MHKTSFTTYPYLCHDLAYSSCKQIALL